MGLFIFITIALL